MNLLYRHSLWLCTALVHAVVYTLHLASRTSQPASTLWPDLLDNNPCEYHRLDEYLRQRYQLPSTVVVPPLVSLHPNSHLTGLL